jgi:ERCC4-related helicase
MSLSSDQVASDVQVRRTSNPAIIGRLTGRTMAGLIPKAEVAWPTGTEYLPLAALDLFDPQLDQGMENLVARGEYAGIDVFRSLLTFEKLRGTLTNVVYSMQTADIDFYAHQFVPVLKFIQSPLEKLLIADEVGLGKTIEAGLIWTECRARNQAKRLLVVCPPTLVPKWVKELNERFEVPAEAVDMKGLALKLERLEERPDLPFALVTSYHALRPDSPQMPYLRGLVDARSNDELQRTFDEAPPALRENKRFRFLETLAQWDREEPFADLVIFDEGHLMKNTATATHMVGRVLEQAAAAMIILSATPLTNRTRDLYSLLRLVDPNMFPDEGSFHSMKERNEPVIRLLKELGRDPIDQEACTDLLARIPDSGAKRVLEQRIKAAEPGMSPSDLVALKAEAQRLNELGSYLTRTRKVDVVGDKVIRLPVVLEVEPSNEEAALYQGLLKLIRKRVNQRGEVPGIFHLMASALSMASCMPSMAERMKDGKIRWGTLEDLEEMQQMEQAFEEEDTCEFVGETSQELTWEPGALANHDFAANDRKYEALRDELFRRLKSADPDAPEERPERRKVIVFAFFKATLRYLHKRLEQDGIRCILVTGDITDTEERFKALNSFKDSAANVMLCSEVAAEGVDLQFCRILVNYDMPWNPMRVEQRIGRIDRIGQKAKRIVIVNLLTKGTIDASIYHHLHTKIGLFESTIGELEGIIGTEINRLTRALLADELSPEECAKQIEATARAVENTRQMESEVNQQSENLVGLRNVLQDAVNQDRSLGRYIKPDELRRFVDDFFRKCYSGSDACELNWDTPGAACLTLTFSHKAYEDFGQYLQRMNIGQWPKGFRNQKRLVSLVFDPELHTKLKEHDRGLQLINHIHPFIQWVAESRGKHAEQWHPVSAVRARSSSFAEGYYFYAISKSALGHHILKREELLHRAAVAESDLVLSREDSESLIQFALDFGEPLILSSPYQAGSRLLTMAQDACSKDHQQIELEFVNELELRRNAKLKQVESHYRGKMAATEKTIATIKHRPLGQQRGLAGFEKNLANLKANFEIARRKISNQEVEDATYKPIACGIIQILRP